ncbi:hypothetical protein BCR44DRAFT_86531 [Catenaria anguillulae PL171]|uniref:Phosphatidate phosphatase APP1 catalytic domain-containing protein n=1 Tax=Catenaria anguillulae PL171 TaxID=765915 RepID=A0A1Y2I2G9_9FUNG|nr:hypothetical protein BCR44DRAFT_86531 [Catenaria anguillulae PL171]
MPYQVATLQEGEPMTPEPQNAEVSYLVLAPEIDRLSGGGGAPDQSGGPQTGDEVGQDPSQQQPGSGGMGGGQSSRAQGPVLRKHVAVVSEIDDVLKETQLASPRQALLNTFAEIYQPTPGMPNVFQDTLAQSFANNSTALTFHYITGAPIPLAPSYLQFLNAHYPYGSLTVRPTAAFVEQSFIDRLKDGSTYKYAAVSEVLSAFPDANVVVFAEARSLQTYVDLVAENPTQIACLYLRTPTPVPGDGQSGETQVTQQRAVLALRQRLSDEMVGRAERIIKVFSNPAELLRLNYTTSPIQCA